MIWILFLPQPKLVHLNLYLNQTINEQVFSHIDKYFVFIINIFHIGTQWVCVFFVRWLWTVLNATKLIEKVWNTVQMLCRKQIKIGCNYGKYDMFQQHLCFPEMWFLNKHCLHVQKSGSEQKCMHHCKVLINPP